MDRLANELARSRRRWAARDVLMETAHSLLVLLTGCLLPAWLDYKLGFSRATRLAQLAALLALAAWLILRRIRPSFWIERGLDPIID